MKTRFHRAVSILLAASAIVSIPLQSAQACSRVLWNDNSLGVFVSRTMDWPETTEPVLTVFPRGMERDGGLVGDHSPEEFEEIRQTAEALDIESLAGP